MKGLYYIFAIAGFIAVLSTLMNPTITGFVTGSNGDYFSEIVNADPYYWDQLRNQDPGAYQEAKQILSSSISQDEKDIYLMSFIDNHPIEDEYDVYYNTDPAGNVNDPTTEYPEEDEFIEEEFKDEPDVDSQTGTIIDDEYVNPDGTDDEELVEETTTQADDPIGENIEEEIKEDKDISTEPTTEPILDEQTEDEVEETNVDPDGTINEVIEEEQKEEQEEDVDETETTIVTDTTTWHYQEKLQEITDSAKQRYPLAYENLLLRVKSATYTNEEKYKSVERFLERYQYNQDATITSTTEPAKEEVKEDDGESTLQEVEFESADIEENETTVVKTFYVEEKEDEIVEEEKLEELKEDTTTTQEEKIIRQLRKDNPIPEELQDELTQRVTEDKPLLPALKERQELKEAIAQKSPQQVRSEQKVVEAIEKATETKVKQRVFEERVEKAKQVASTKKELVVEEDKKTNKTTSTVKIKVTVKENETVEVIEEIPKEIAADVSELTFNRVPIVLEADPVVMWVIEDETEEVEISYTVNKSVSTVGNTILLAEEPEPINWTGSLPLFLIPIIIAVFVYFAHYRKEDKN